MYFAKSAESSLICIFFLQLCMRNLAIDIGNTYAKAGFFENHQLMDIHTGLHQKALIRLLKQNRFEKAILSSVTHMTTALEKALHPASQVIYLDNHVPLPFVNLYNTPHTLGTDRIAAVAGATALFPYRNALVIDAGTCITYDFVDARCQYQGGAIAPGIQMRLQAMHTFTARLPLVSTAHVHPKDIPLTGKSTSEALLSGAVRGTASEITQMIRMYADKFADLQIIICGGDAVFLSDIIQSKHEVVPELTLVGLNRILDYNVS